MFHFFDPIPSLKLYSGFGESVAEILKDFNFGMTIFFLNLKKSAKKIEKKLFSSKNLQKWILRHFCYNSMKSWYLDPKPASNVFLFKMEWRMILFQVRIN